MVKYFYVQLNENNVGVFIISAAKKVEGATNLVEIPEYNETYVGRMWDGTQWSQERYEPSIEVVLQQKVEQLEQQNSDLLAGINALQEQGAVTEGVLMEMMAVISTLTNGGAM